MAMSLAGFFMGGDRQGARCKKTHTTTAFFVWDLRQS